MTEPAGYRWRFEDSDTWHVQKNKPHWYTPDQTDIVIEPLFPSGPLRDAAPDDFQLWFGSAPCQPWSVPKAEEPK